VTVAGAGCAALLGACAVSGVILSATLRLVPARDWVALLASAGSWADAVAVAGGLAALDPPARLVSVDEPNLVATYPANDAMPAGRHSVRAVVDASTVAAAGRVVDGGGGRVEAVRPESVGYLSALAFTHVILRARAARPRLCHVELTGPAVLDRIPEIRDLFPGGLLHLDAVRGGFDAVLLTEYPGADDLYANLDQVGALGVAIRDPHSWLVPGPATGAIRDRAAEVDPGGLLNPGKLP
jgi:FAD/FMN-containing dehydrogenase